MDNMLEKDPEKGDEREEKGDEKVEPEKDLYPDHPEGKLIPDGLKSTLKDLYLISKIEENQKFNVKSRSFANSSLLDRFSRWFEKESRKESIKKIDDIVNSGISCLNLYTDPDFRKMILGGLKGCKKGIENLMKTYESDADVLSDLHLMILNINMQFRISLE